MRAVKTLAEALREVGIVFVSDLFLLSLGLGPIFGSDVII